MTTIQIKIKDCSECPFHKVESVYTADSFENISKWICKKAKNIVIDGCVGWTDKVKIPNWCPVRVRAK